MDLPEATTTHTARKIAVKTGAMLPGLTLVVIRARRQAYCARAPQALNCSAQKLPVNDDDSSSFAGS